MPRIERCISIIGIISEKLGKDLDCLEIEDIEEFLNWYNVRILKIGRNIPTNRFLKLILRKLEELAGLQNKKVVRV